MPNAAETVEAQYTVAEHLTFLPQPAIGTIEIPLQERPTYLKRGFGNLRENQVIIRDGSSTRVATPEEIAKMGAEEAIDSTLKLEPRFRIWLVDGEGREVETIEADHYLFEPMSGDDIRDCIQLLKSTFPLETDFGSHSPVKKAGKAVVDRIMGLEYLYTPASSEDIARYTEEEYPMWIKKCEEYLSRLHDTLQSEIEQPLFTFVAVNEGNRPGRDALINLSTGGELRICPPPYQCDTEKEAKAEISLPTPPQPPKGRGSWKSSLLAISALANPHFGIRGLSYAGLKSPLPLPSVSSNNSNRRDPNAFYYKPNRSTTPVQSFSLECEQWRHGTGEKDFSGQLFFGNDKEKVNGLLTCEVHAENLSSPAKRTVPVEISIKRLNTPDRARLLVRKLLKAAK